MIELIFVIVILGILASVAIPRLAATREDAEISAAVANLRTLVSDATAYYTAKGEFGSTTKWSEITNVPLNIPTNNNTELATKDGQLKVGDQNDCIAVALRERNGNAPAHIVIAKKSTASGSICQKVQNAAPLQAYFNSKAAGVQQPANGAGTIAIGSNTSIYDEQTTSTTSS